MGAVLPASEFISASVVVLGVRLNLAIDNRTDETIYTCSTYIALHDDYISSVLVEHDMIWDVTD